MAEVAGYIEAPKKREQILISTIKLEEIKAILESGYDAIVNAVTSDLNAMAKEYEAKIMAEVKKGDWTKAQKIIDGGHPMFQVDVINGTKVKVSIADYKGIKRMLVENKKVFVKEVDELLKGNMASEITVVRSNWSLNIGTEAITDKKYKQNVELLAELLTKNINEVIGVTPPKGIKPAMVADNKVPEAKKIDFADATVPKGSLPIYAMHENNKVVVYWPAWIRERRKELAEVVPEKKKVK